MTLTGPRRVRKSDQSTAEASPRRNGKKSGARIVVRFTARELALMTSLVSDQLFRREFIDPRLPGYKPNPGELSLGKQLAERLRVLSARAAADGNGTRK